MSAMSESDEFFSKWFVSDHWRWRRLAAFYQVDTYTAYATYLELCAVDEHHFSEKLRNAIRVNNDAIGTRVIYPECRVICPIGVGLCMEVEKCCTKHS